MVTDVWLFNRNVKGFWRNSSFFIWSKSFSPCKFCMTCSSSTTLFLNWLHREVFGMYMESDWVGSLFILLSFTVLLFFTVSGLASTKQLKKGMCKINCLNEVNV